MLTNLRLSESPNGPAVISSHLVKTLVVTLPILSTVPVVAVSLDNKPSILEHKVGLEPPKHSLMHLELQPSLHKLCMECSLQNSHLARESLSQSSLAAALSTLRGAVGGQHLFSSSRRAPELQGALPHFFSGFGGETNTLFALANPCTYVCRKLSANQRIYSLRDMFGRLWATLSPQPTRRFCSFIDPAWHDLIVPQRMIAA